MTTLGLAEKMEILRAILNKTVDPDEIADAYKKVNELIEKPNPENEDAY